MSINGSELYRNASWQPQVGQKYRVPTLVEAKAVGLPWVNRN